MANVVISGDTSGSVTLSAPAVAGTTTLTLPATSGTILQSGTTVTEAQGGTGTTTGYYGFKNRIINGAMVIDQRNAGASVTQTTSAPYTLDRFYCFGSVSSKFTVQQNAGSVTPPTGFINYLGATSSSAYTVGSTEQFNIAQPIEGLNCTDLGWGASGASSVTLSFWVRSSLTGTFGGSLRNSATNYSYPFSYTISSANTWTSIAITIAGATSGTWLTTNGVGIYVNFSMGAGSTLSGTAGSWSANNYTSATGATSVVGTNGATFYITGVQLEKGSTATSFDYRPYGTELQLCYRYLPWHTLGTATIGALGQATSTGIAYYTLPFQTAARANPSGITLTAGTLSAGNATFGNAGGTGVFNSGQTTQGQIIVTGATGLTAGDASYLYPSTTMTILWTGCEL